MEALDQITADMAGSAAINMKFLFYLVVCGSSTRSAKVRLKARLGDANVLETLGAFCSGGGQSMQWPRHLEGLADTHIDLEGIVAVPAVQRNADVQSDRTDRAEISKTATDADPKVFFKVRQG